MAQVSKIGEKREVVMVQEERGDEWLGQKCNQERSIEIERSTSR
jgi:hypothetical protein